MKIRKYISLLLLGLCIGLGQVSYAQNYADKSMYLIDSLSLEKLSHADMDLLISSLKSYHSATTDTAKINALERICENMVYQDWKKYQYFQHDLLESALNKSQDEKTKKRLLSSQALSLNNIGYIYMSNGNSEKAIDYFLQSLMVDEKLENDKGASTTLGNIGSFYYNQGNIPLALDYYDRALTLNRKVGQKTGVAVILNNLGMIYKDQGDIKKALNYYYQSEKIRLELDDKEGISIILNNIGSIYAEQNDHEKALENYNKSLEISLRIGSKNGIAHSYNNIGDLYYDQNKISTSFDFHLKALEIREEINDKAGIANSLNNLGTIELQRGNIAASKVYAERSLKIAREIYYPEIIKQSAALLSDIFERQNNGMEALEMHKLFVSMKDSISNQETQHATAQLQAKYQYNTQKAIDDAEYDKILITLALVTIFLIFIFHRLWITRKQKRIITEQKYEVEDQKMIIEETYKEITASIAYAKHLQDAILPSFDEVNKHLPNNFIFYKPKDVVSGDFYWFEQIDGVSYFAVADCTGHGVPGAMVSVVCSSALNRSVKQFGLKQPAEILNKTRALVIETFAKNGGELKDGMDIALCALDGKKVVFSGANNPLWVVRETDLLSQEQIEDSKTISIGSKSLITFRADRQPIGLNREMKDFTQAEIQLYTDDCLYFFTDGFADQFGGEKGKKFMNKQFKKFLMDIEMKDMKKQRLLISDKFEKWKGELEQIDDVCVVGVKI